jgi:hypothetical protein
MIRTKTKVKKEIHLPNLSIPKWIEDNCPTVYTRFKRSLFTHGEFVESRDIYHQPLSVVLKVIQELLEPIPVMSTWLDSRLKMDLMELENKLFKNGTKRKNI